MTPRITLNVDLDDVTPSASIAKVGSGVYESWQMQFRFLGSEVTFDASSSDDLEALLDSLQHDLVVLRSGGARRADGVPA